VNKIAIIGGGIAGFSIRILLNRAGYNVCISEREHGLPDRGNAFLLHPDGQKVINHYLGEDLSSVVPGKNVRHFNHYSTAGDVIKDEDLMPWKCVKRRDFMSFLANQFPETRVYGGRVFSHFEYNEKRIAVKAVFENGDEEYADIFIGADGSNSKVREAIFGKTAYTKTEVKEVVGVTYHAEFAKKYDGIFTKYQDLEKGRAFGFIPSTENEVVWFFQYDISIDDLKSEMPDVMQAFCERNLADFPQPVKDLIAVNDYKTSYLWRTKDFDTLSSFHKNNVVLMGDAAHLSLPFASAGTTNALVDSQTLFECLEKYKHYKHAFEEFYTLRNPHITLQLYYARKLKDQFLNPVEHPKFDIPLI